MAGELRLTRSTLLRAGVLAPLATLAACQGDPPDGAAPSGTPSSTSADPPATDPPATGSGPVPQPRIAETLVTGLAVPWGLAFLPDGGAVVSERDTAEVVVVGTTGVPQARRTVPGVESNASFGGEGGLMGLVLSPDGRWLYAAFTSADDNRVVRIPWPGWGSPEVVLEGIPQALHHNGGGLAFGPDGMLYVATGDAEDRDAAPDESTLNGKVLRITPEGGVPSDNPYGNEVWSRGHRNVEGLAFDAQGQLWASEFGEDRFDELNLVVPGGDYGWPRAEGADGAGGGRDPLAQWATDDCSPAGIAIAGGRAWLGALRGECVWSVDLASGESRRHLEGHGRIRLVAAAPDGSLWVGTSNHDGRGDPRRGDDRIFRVTL